MIKLVRWTKVLQELTWKLKWNVVNDHRVCKHYAVFAVKLKAIEPVCEEAEWKKTFEMKF